MNEPRETNPLVPGELKWVSWLAACVMIATCVTLVVGYAGAEKGMTFLGFPFNVADSMVYLSWMRQSADGNFFIKNLFTSEAQKGNGFNLLFLVLGLIARIFKLPLIVVYQVSRIVLGFIFLLATYRFLCLFARGHYERRLAIILICLSSGLGWFFAVVLRMDIPRIGSPDLWQPEAITFTSLYWSPLFCFALLLMVAVLYNLLRFTCENQWKYIIPAGLALGLLANVHTYDVLTLGIAWFVYCIYKLRTHEGIFQSIIGGLASAVIAAPLIAYQVYFYFGEPIFRARVATATISPSIGWVLAGFGFLVPLAIFGMVTAMREGRDVSLLVCWAAGGIVGAYLPVPFQRKLVMGTHIPICILAAIGIHTILRRVRPPVRIVASVIIVMLLVPTNILKLGWDMRDIRRNLDSATGLAYYVSAAQLGCIASLRNHAHANDIILAPPQMSTLIPGLAGRQVFCGHWGECPDAPRKTQEAFYFFSTEASDSERKEFLRKERIAFVVEDHTWVYANMPLADFRCDPPDFLVPIFCGEDVNAYRVSMKTQFVDAN